MRPFATALKRCSKRCANTSSPMSQCIAHAGSTRHSTQGSTQDRAANAHAAPRVCFPLSACLMRATIRRSTLKSSAPPAHTAPTPAPRRTVEIRRCAACVHASSTHHVALIALNTAESRTPSHNPCSTVASACRCAVRCARMLRYVGPALGARWAARRAHLFVSASEERRTESDEKAPARANGMC